jgi:hypothetical protein
VTDVRLVKVPNQGLFFAAEHVTLHLRNRADELAEACNGALCDEHATAYRYSCEELRRMADELDSAVIVALPAHDPRG